tara:strand:- start:45 stop:569 length:525 start_codon:yes stop_codon:yes gene_type:complete
MKLELSEKLLEEIDFVLNEASISGKLAHSFKRNDLTYKAIQYCLSLNFIRTKSNSEYELDEKGIFAIQDGGIEKYLYNIRSEKDLDKAIKVLISRNLKYQFLYSVILVILGFLLSFVPNELNESKKKLETKQLQKSISEKSELNDSYQKLLNHKNTLILELKHEIDSLKTPQLN